MNFQTDPLPLRLGSKNLFPNFGTVYEGRNAPAGAMDRPDADAQLCSDSLPVEALRAYIPWLAPFTCGTD